MKKLISVLILTAMTMTLISCGEAETSSVQSIASAEPSQVSSGVASQNDPVEIPEIYFDSIESNLFRYINNNNWYRGEYSIFNNLRGKTLNVEAYQALGTYDGEVYYYLEDGGEYVYVKLTAADEPSPVLELWNYDIMTQTEKEENIENINGQVITKNITFTLSVPQEPIHPDKLTGDIQEKPSEETLAEINKIIECINKGSGFVGTAYIRQVGNPYNRDWKNYSYTDVFVEDVAGEVKHLTYETGYNSPYGVEVYRISEIVAITKEDIADWYYYKKVKETTDWVVDIETWMKSGLELMPNNTVTLDSIPYNENTEEENGYYLTEQGIKESLDYCINSDLWYNGKYSEWYDKIGETYNVLGITYMSEVGELAETKLFIYPDEAMPVDEEILFMTLSVPYNSKTHEYGTMLVDIEYEVNSDILPTEQDLIDCFGTELESNYFSRIPEFTYTVKEPVKPSYGQSEMLEDRLDSVKTELKTFLSGRCFNEEIEVYIKPFIAEKARWDEENDNAVLIDMQIFYETEKGKVFKTSFGSTNGATNGVGFFDGVDLVDEAEEKYFYKQVKETTDIKFSLDIEKNTDLMLYYLTYESWYKFDEDEWWSIYVSPQSDIEYYFSVDWVNGDSVTQCWEIYAVYDEDTGRLNYEECEIAKIDNEGNVEYLNESGGGYFYVKDGGLHWTDYTMNINSWIFY